MEFPTDVLKNIFYQLLTHNIPDDENYVVYLSDDEDDEYLYPPNDVTTHCLNTLLRISKFFHYYIMDIYPRLFRDRFMAQIHDGNTCYEWVQFNHELINEFLRPGNFIDKSCHKYLNITLNRHAYEHDYNIDISIKVIHDYSISDGSIVILKMITGAGECFWSESPNGKYNDLKAIKFTKGHNVVDNSLFSTFKYGLFTIYPAARAFFNN